MLNNNVFSLFLNIIKMTSGDLNSTGSLFTHKVHRWQNYHRYSLFGYVEQPEDWNWRIKDNGRSVLTSARS